MIFGGTRRRGLLYYHARGTSPDRGCLTSHSLIRSAPIPAPNFFEDGTTRRLQEDKCSGIFAIRISGSPKSATDERSEPRTLFGVRRKRRALRAAEPAPPTICGLRLKSNASVSFIGSFGGAVRSPLYFRHNRRAGARRSRARPFCCGGELSPLYEL